MNEIPKNSQGQSIPQQTQAQAQKVEQVKTEAVQDARTAANAEVQAKEIKEINFDRSYLRNNIAVKHGYFCLRQYSRSGNSANRDG